LRTFSLRLFVRRVLGFIGSLDIDILILVGHLFQTAKCLRTSGSVQVLITGKTELTMSWQVSIAFTLVIGVNNGRKAFVVRIKVSKIDVIQSSQIESLTPPSFFLQSICDNHL
jgi:hypothetical protein